MYHNNRHTYIPYTEYTHIYSYDAYTPTLGAGSEREIAGAFPTLPVSLLQVNTFISQLFLAQV
jgi:hypothetical protein